MAYKGFGVWALVAQYLVNTTIDTIVLQITLHRFPKIRYSLRRIKSLFKFGWKILAASLLNNGFQELRSFMIGKYYSSSDLGYFTKGKQFPEILVININTSISSVMFAKMSKEQDDIKLLKQTTRNSIRYSSYILSPMMFGLAAIATSFISVLLTDKWLFAVPYLQLYCLFYLVQPIHGANMQAIKALGRSDIYFILEIIKKSIEIIVLVICLKFGVMAIAISAVILNYLFVIINSFPNRKLLNYSLKEQILDITPPMVMGIIMFLLVGAIGSLALPKIVLLVIQVLFGVFVYFILSSATNNKEFKYFNSMVTRFVKRRR